LDTEGIDRVKPVCHARLFGVLLGGTVSMAKAAQPMPAPEGGRTYYWNHPKLGAVKVARATGAIVVPLRPEAPRSDQAADSSRIEYWVDPRSNLRRSGGQAAT